MQNTTTSTVLDLIPVSEWGKHYDYPKQSTLRQLIFYNKNNFIERVVRKINSRQFIKVSALNEWIEETGKKA